MTPADAFAPINAPCPTLPGCAACLPTRRPKPTCEPAHPATGPAGSRICKQIRSPRNRCASSNRPEPLFVPQAFPKVCLANFQWPSQSPYLCCFTKYRLRRSSGPARRPKTSPTRPRDDMANHGVADLVEQRVYSEVSKTSVQSSANERLNFCPLPLIRFCFGSPATSTRRFWLPQRPWAKPPGFQILHPMDRHSCERRPCGERPSHRMENMPS